MKKTIAAFLILQIGSPVAFDPCVVPLKPPVLEGLVIACDSKECEEYALSEYYKHLENKKDELCYKAIDYDAFIREQIKNCYNLPEEQKQLCIESNKLLQQQFYEKLALEWNRTLVTASTAYKDAINECCENLP
jgi:hypothetical protein